MTIDIEDLKQKAEAATPGARKVHDHGVLDSIHFIDSEESLVCSHEDLYWSTDADRDFVAACSREAILELFKRIEREQSWRRSAEETVSHLHALLDAQGINTDLGLL